MILWGWATAAWAEEGFLSLDDAVARALAGASEASVALDDAEIARLAALDARLDQLPAFGVSGEAEWNTAVQGHPGTPSFTSADGVAWYRATVGLSGTLLAGKGMRAKAARELLTAAQAGGESARRDLVQATVEAYYAVALSRARLEAAESTATAAADLANRTSLRFEGGEVPEVDALRQRVVAAGRAGELEEARAEAAVSAATLAVFIASDASWQVADLLATAPDPAEVDAVLATSTSRSPEIDRAQGELAASEAEIRAARASWAPSIAYHVGYGIDTDTVGTDWRDHLGATAGVAVDLPLFDWGLGEREVEAARLAADQASARYDLAQRDNAARRVQAEIVARTAAARAQTLLAVLPDAERATAISRARYLAGEADLVEVTEADQALVDARDAAAVALFDYQAALAELTLLVSP